MKSKIMNSFARVIVILILAGIMPMGTSASEVQVKIINDQFTPASIQVKIGDTVTWSNEESSTHTITGFGTDQNMSAGSVFSHKFNEAGTFDYECAIHAGMKGKVIVSAVQTQTVNPITNNTTTNNAQTVTAPAPTAVTLSAEVTPANVVDVVTTDTAEASDTASQAVAIEAATQVAQTLTSETPQATANAISSVESNVSTKIQSINAEIKKDPARSEELMKKIMVLKTLVVNLRAKTIVQEPGLTAELIKVKNLPKLYEIRWGDLSGKREKCTGIILNDLRDALLKDEIPDKCDEAVTKNKYDGIISVDRGELKIHKEILFDKGDRTIDTSGTTISFASVIAGHWDGLIVEYIPPKTDTTATVPVNTTIKIGELDKTFSGDEVLGQKSISIDHMIEIKPLVQAAPGLALGVQKNLITGKLNLQEKIVELRNKIDKIRLLKDVGGGADEIEGAIDVAGQYNFDTATAAIVQTEISNAAKNIGLDTSSDELKSKADTLQNKIEELKSQARAYKLEAKLIPFKDTDDDQWYTDYVSAVKNQGIISGYQDTAGNDLNEFRPSNNVTVAEILKIGLETSGNGKDNSKAPTLSGATSHWAKGYVAKAEKLELDLTKNNTSLDRPATRGEVVRMMLEALGITPDPVSSTDFSDVQTTQANDTGVAAYIQYAKKLGIVSGDAGKTTFRPNDPINRAEVAKIANQIIEVLMGGINSAVTGAGDTLSGANQ